MCCDILKVCYILIHCNANGESSMQATSTFQVGRTYSTRSICDYDCIISLTVAKRTEKTITSTDGKTFRVKVNAYGEETVKPWGSYSMAPILGASD